MNLAILILIVLFALAHGFELIRFAPPGCGSYCPQAAVDGRYWTEDCSYPDCSPLLRLSNCLDWVTVRTWAGSYVGLNRAHLAALGWLRYFWRKWLERDCPW